MTFNKDIKAEDVYKALAVIQVNSNIPNLNTIVSDMEKISEASKVLSDALPDLMTGYNLFLKYNYNIETVTSSFESKIIMPKTEKSEDGK